MAGFDLVAILDRIGEIPMVHEDIQRYYREYFQSVNGQGITGFATNVVHWALEKPYTRATHFSSVLELGAALGDHARFVRHGYDEYVITDVQDHGIRITDLMADCPTGGGLRKIRFQIEDAHRLSFEDRRFDRVLHTCLLHHLDDPETAMSEVRRVLRFGGTASFHLPCDPGLVYRGIQRVTAGRRIRSALKRNNFDIKYGYLRAVEHPNHYSALIALVKHVFRHDQMRISNYPLPFGTWDVNLFTVVHVQKVIP